MIYDVASLLNCAYTACVRTHRANRGWTHCGVIIDHLYSIYEVSNIVPRVYKYIFVRGLNAEWELAQWHRLIYQFMNIMHLLHLLRQPK